MEILSLFTRNPGPDQDNYCPYFCPAAELEDSYGRCCSSGVPATLAKPQEIITKTLLAARLEANSLLLTFAEQVIAPACHVGPEKDYIYILCDSDLNCYISYLPHFGICANLWGWRKR